MYEYLSLVESVRDGAKVGHRTLLRLGEVTALRESGQLERIVAALESHLRRERVDVGALAAEGAPAVGAVAAVAAVWRRLGLDGWFAAAGSGRAAAVGDAVFAMAANRLVAPCSKRRLTEWAETDVVMPEWWSAPSLNQYYRALDAVAGAKDATEQHLYARLCDLANLDLRLVCYDLTSTYFEGRAQPSERFPSRAFGYSRDHRGDRPQIVIGLLCTADGVPVAHHVSAGNAGDASTLPGVLADLAGRFAVGRICVVADRGLISSDNVEAVAAAGFDHVLAARLRRDHTAKEALEAIDGDTAWAEMPQHRCRATDIALTDGTRAIVVESDARARRDDTRRGGIVAAAEAELLALERRVREGRLKDPAEIGRAAQRILDNNSGAGRLFDLEIAQGRFLYHYNDHALAYEQLLHRPDRRRLPPTRSSRGPLRGPQGLPAPATRQTLDRETSPRPHRRLRLRRRHRDPHQPGPRQSRRPRPRPRRPAPNRRPGPARAQPNPTTPSRRQRPPDPAHHPPHTPPGPNPRRCRSRHPQLGQSRHRLTSPNHTEPPM